MHYLCDAIFLFEKLLICFNSKDNCSHVKRKSVPVPIFHEKDNRYLTYRKTGVIFISKESWYYSFQTTVPVGCHLERQQASVPVSSRTTVHVHCICPLSRIVDNFHLEILLLRQKVGVISCKISVSIFHILSWQCTVRPLPQR